MKVDNKASILHVVLLLYELNQHIFVEDGDIKIVVPLIVEFVLLDELADREVLKVEGLVK